MPLTSDHIPHPNGYAHVSWSMNEKHRDWQEDDKWNKTGGWLASILGSRSLPSLAPTGDEATWSDVWRRILGAPDLEADRRTANRSHQSHFSFPSLATVRFLLLCVLWYTSSALSSNTGKAILTRFRFPVTLTFVQFGFIALYCLLFSSRLIRLTRLRKPTLAIIKTAIPMALFQVAGHVFSSMAISRIPVSTVHTVKALSPLFTVGAYALLFGVSYSLKTYLSLLPLTFGVMLACSFDVTVSNLLGIVCAFGSAMVFVSSNIFFKKIMPTAGSAAPAQKLDKLNLMFYSSGMAFVLMIPIWAYSDLGPLLSRWSAGAVVHPHTSHPHGVLYYFFLNGTVHFAQNIIAISILASTSPVTYSIASLIKRIAVILIAIAWFRQSVHPVQAIGICLTSVGLWMYNHAKPDVDRGENQMRRVEAARDLILPSTNAESLLLDPGGIAREAVSSSFNRRASMESIQNQEVEVTLKPPSYSQHAPAPLQIPTTSSTRLVTGTRLNVTSPIESYPSPPPSFDSPPPTSLALHGASSHVFTRRSHDATAELNRSATPVTAISHDHAEQVPRHLPIAITAQ